MPNRHVEHVVFGRLDLTLPDLGTAGGAQLLERLLADDRLPVEVRGLVCAEECMTAGYTEPMYVYRRLGRVVAAHLRTDAEERHQPAVTDEHRAYVARAVRAAEEDGHQVAVEQPTPDRKVRSDALIRGAGGVLLGFESQVSPETGRRLKARDSAARRSGLADIWQTTLHALVELGVVPMLRTDDLPAAIIERRHNPLTFRSGVRRIELVRCDDRAPTPCPRRKAGGRCGADHPRTRPMEVAFDQFIRDAAAGQLVRTVLREKRGGRAFEFWTPLSDHLARLSAEAEADDTEAISAEQAADEALACQPCRAMSDDGDPTCRSRHLSLDTWAPPRHASGPEPHPFPPRPQAPHIPAVRAGRCGAGTGTAACGDTARLYPGGWYCDQHRPNSHQQRAG